MIKKMQMSRSSLPHSCLLPIKMGWFRNFLLKMVFGAIQIDPEQLKIIHDLPEDALLVYVNKNKSNFEFLFSYFQYARNGAPTPQVAFDYRFYFWQPFSKLAEMCRNKILSIKNRRPLPDAYTGGHIRETLISCKAGFLSLVAKSGFSARWTGTGIDPLEYLIVLQRQLDHSIYFVPQLLFFDRRPNNSIPSLIDIFFGSKQKPGYLRRLLAVVRKPEEIFVEISEPFGLNEFLNQTASGNLDDEALAEELRRRLLGQINAHRQRITGPVLKSGEELRQTVLTSPELTRYIQKLAVRKQIHIADARREAVGYFDEIAAKYSSRFIALAAATWRWLLSNLFDKINVDLEGLNNVKRRHLKGPLIFTPCHKSNMDTLTLMTVLHANHVHCPHTFAGQNLSFWPVGPLIRRTGAFFMRRSFKGAVFYVMVFTEYIKTLLREGHSLEVFIEGTRSRSGKLSPPQAGGLSMLINACQSGACPDLVFVPVFIGYDRIPEEGSYLHEIQGGQKTKEGLWMMIKGGKMLKSRYGQIYFRFAEPVVLSDLMEQEHLALSEPLKGKELNQFSQKLGQRLLYEIQCTAVITPQALAAAALLGVSRQNINVFQIIDIVETYLTYLSSKNVFFTDALTLNSAAAVTHALEYFTQRRMIEPIQIGDSTDHFKIPANKRSSLEFYKNNVIGQLVPAAFTALLILSADMFQFGANHLHADYAFLQELFANEFIFDPDQSAAFQVRKAIKAFINDAILVPHPTLPDNYNITSPGYRKLQLFSDLLKPLFEAYNVSLSYYHDLGDKLPSAKKDRIKGMRALAQHMCKQNQIDRTEAISEVYLTQADAVFCQLGFHKECNKLKSERYLRRIHGYLRHLP